MGLLGGVWKGKVAGIGPVCAYLHLNLSHIYRKASGLEFEVDI